MPAQKQTIDFLPKEDWEKTGLGKFLKWALTIGRYIVIFTEFIVISAFLFRFKLDRDLTDLYEKVKQRVAVVKSTMPFEKDFRFLQRRLNYISETEETGKDLTKIFDYITKSVPINVSLSQIKINESKISISAIALSESGVASFIKNLKNNNRLSDITIAQISSKASGEGAEIGFVINGVVSDEKKQ